MRMQDVMSDAVESVAPSTTAADARARMKMSGIHHLVVRDGKTVVGVVSSRDLGTNAGQTPVRDLMSAHIATAGPTTTVKQAANILRGRGIGCLPVMDGGKLVGIVTVSDLLELVGKGLDKPLHNRERWLLSRRGVRRKAVERRP